MDNGHEGLPRLRKKDSDPSMIGTQSYEGGYSDYTRQPRLIAQQNDSSSPHVTRNRHLTFPTPDETIDILENVEEATEEKEFASDKTGTETYSHIDDRNMRSNRPAHEPDEPEKIVSIHFKCINAYKIYIIY